MSTITVQASTSAAASVVYVLAGRGASIDDLDTDQHRAAARAISMSDGGSTPLDFIARAERLAAAHGRRVQVHSYVLAFSPDEFDVTNQSDLDRVRDVAVKLAKRLHSADYLVVVHKDSAGGHVHAHILIMNHDNLTGTALTRHTSWRHGVHQINDALMRDEGLAVLPSPTAPRPDWEQRREQFAEGGFDQRLGDIVYDAASDPRSIDRASFRPSSASTASRWL